MWVVGRAQQERWEKGKRGRDGGWGKLDEKNHRLSNTIRLC